MAVAFINHFSAVSCVCFGVFFQFARIFSQAQSASEHTVFVLSGQKIDDRIFCIGVNFLTVNPGFAGQKLVPSTIQKARNLIPYLKERGKENIDFEADGNMSYENIALFKEIGANIFVLGTSSVFNDDMKNSIQKVQQILKG